MSHRRDRAEKNREQGAGRAQPRRLRPDNPSVTRRAPPLTRGYDMNVRIIRNSARRLHGDERGLTTVEYVIVLVLVSVGASIAVIGLGALLLELFLYQRSLLLLPFP